MLAPGLEQVLEGFGDDGLALAAADPPDEIELLEVFVDEVLAQGRSLPAHSILEERQHVGGGRRVHRRGRLKPCSAGRTGATAGPVNPLQAWYPLKFSSVGGLTRVTISAACFQRLGLAP